jgi:hypothetical protein
MGQQQSRGSTGVRWRGERPSRPEEASTSAEEGMSGSRDGAGGQQMLPRLSRKSWEAGRGSADAPSAAALTIEHAEWHGRIEQDWYAATAMVDLLTFIYVAIFYQVLVSPIEELKPQVTATLMT